MARKKKEVVKLTHEQIVERVKQGIAEDYQDNENFKLLYLEYHGSKIDVDDDNDTKHEFLYLAEDRGSGLFLDFAYFYETADYVMTDNVDFGLEDVIKIKNSKFNVQTLEALYGPKNEKT